MKLQKLENRVKDKLSSLEISYDGDTVTAKIERVKFTLPEMGKVKLEADLEIKEKKQNEQISFTAVPEVSSAGDIIELKSVEYDRQAEYNQNIAKAIIDSAEEILDLRNFEVDEMSLRVRKLEVEAGKLSIEADAVIENFPDA